MTELVQTRLANAGRQGPVGLVDCDIHPSPQSPAELEAFLPERWRTHLRTYGSHVRMPLPSTLTHPRMAAATARADAWPPRGGVPGSDLDFMREQHLEPNQVGMGVLIPLPEAGARQRNLDFGAALCTAVNDWLRQQWLDREPRLRASMTVPPEDPALAVAEIERRAGDPAFVQILLPPRSTEPLGRRRYWPIYEAATRYDLPIALHIGGMGGHPCTGSGWPSYYFEEHHSNVQTMEALMTSMVIEGVFERFPTLRVLLIESGFAWVPALSWRLDKQWRRMRDEVPHLRRPPSEYVRDHFWYTTQPMDEPERPSELLTTIDWVGWDRIMFATDYPHWDFDDPKRAFKAKLTREQEEAVFRGNANVFYKTDVKEAA